MTDISTLFPSKYLKASDAEPALTLTISKITQESMKNRDGEDETKPVIFFQEVEKGMVLNKTNAKTLTDMFGSTIENWIGERVVLAAIDVDAFGETQKALRFSRNAPAAPVSHDKLVAKYMQLFQKAKELEVDDLDTFILDPDAPDSIIIELGKELRAAVAAAQAFA